MRDASLSRLDGMSWSWCVSGPYHPKVAFPRTFLSTLPRTLVFTGRSCAVLSCMETAQCRKYQGKKGRAKRWIQSRSRVQLKGEFYWANGYSLTLLTVCNGNELFFYLCNNATKQRSMKNEFYISTVWILRILAALSLWVAYLTFKLTTQPLNLSAFAA